MKSWYANRKNDPDFIKKKKNQSKRSRNELKIQAYAKLGNACACCKESEIEFLTIDHINDDGADHRKKLKGRNSTAIILREIRDGKESHEYQLLCSNCNHIKILPMRKNSFRIQVTQERNYREHLRELVLVKLGGICACCGESNRKLLTIDHIDGDGNAHRKKIGGYVKMLRYIRDLVDTSMFQVLCWNCNMSKGIGTVCIHKRNYV